MATKKSVDMPADETVLYLRGGFNGWGSEHPFTQTATNVYQSKITVAPGNHEFKIASIDWQQEWIIEGADKTPAKLDTVYALTPGGAGSFLFVRTTGDYLFSLERRHEEAPRLKITRSKVQAQAAIKPHQGERNEAALRFTTWDGKTEEARFSVPLPQQDFRHYTHSTTQELRDPLAKFTHYKEKPGYPRLRSGNLPFDALYALALEEMRLNSVTQIRDGNYRQGEAINCECFETGAKWHYVWTRDLAYAADLGLAMYDPQRVRNSLEFKLSKFRSPKKLHPRLAAYAEGEQIVQDTGTGGSWPVSTDRVAWAFGAEAALKYLAGEARDAFAQRAYKALKNTVEIDRLAAFDTRDGLYRGEQSFLDWREQSYAAWIIEDIARLATAKALSTNVAHFKALSLLADLSAELRHPQDQQKYADWARALKVAINDKFWLQDQQQYSSLSASHFDDSALKKYDLLGLALAINTGVAEGERARQALAAYPHGPMGAPVIFPQQLDVPVYHNRAIWPFVTAYALQAAIKLKNVAVADAAYSTLIRAASLNLSNMENLEWLSGQPILLDEKTPRLSGPVINSKRQLWSVGAYLSMVGQGVFGIRFDGEDLALQPFVTTKLHREFFSNSKNLSLVDFVLRDKRLNIHLELPPLAEEGGYYSVESITLNSQPLGGSIAFDDLADKNTIIVKLGKRLSNAQSIQYVAGNPYADSDPLLFVPLSPSLAVSGKSNADSSVRTVIAKRNNKLENASSEPSLSILSQGKTIEQSKTKKSRSLSASVADESLACFAASAAFDLSGNASHHSRPVCLGKRKNYAIDHPWFESLGKKINVQKSDLGPIVQSWGEKEEKIRLDNVTIDRPGAYAVQISYRNLNNQINLGITNAVKWLTIQDNKGAKIAEGAVQMPHTISTLEPPLALSTPLFAQLPIGTYSIVMEDFFNMSYLQANADFTGTGGSAGPVNRFDLAGLSLLQLDDTYLK